MKYMLMIYGPEDAWTDQTRTECYVESAELAQTLNDEGKFIATAPLESVTTAKSLRIREGKSQVTDGPFAETREQLGGFFLVEAANMEEALAIAERIPGARVGTVEVRKVVEVAGLPGS